MLDHQRCTGSAFWINRLSVSLMTNQTLCINDRNSNHSFLNDFSNLLKWIKHQLKKGASASVRMSPQIKGRAWLWLRSCLKGLLFFFMQLPGHSRILDQWVGSLFSLGADLCSEGHLGFSADRQRCFTARCLSSSRAHDNPSSSQTRCARLIRDWHQNLETEMKKLNQCSLRSLVI